MDVGAWLEGLGLGQYEAAFRENAIDGELLPNLIADDLRDIGVGLVGHRRRMLDAIAVLRGAQTPLGEPSATLTPLERDGAERRPITVMFCDLVDSTRLAADLDVEDWRDLVSGYLDEASRAVNQYGGHVLKKLGDGLMALFGYPKAQENDAERAARAGLAILRAIDEINARNVARGLPALAARLGLDSGPVIVDSAGEVYGEAPNVAARVESVAEAGTLLVTEAVQRQVAGLFVAENKGAHALKGVPGRSTLYRILRASGGGRRTGARSLTPLVGREEELAVLVRRWERARGGEGQFVHIVGEPGIGKSRLVEEFRTKLAATPHTWLEWAASQLLQNAPLHPVTEWARQRFGDDTALSQLQAALAEVGIDPDDNAPLLAPLIEIPVAGRRLPVVSAAELRSRQFNVLADWTLAIARTQPLVLWFEDLHWADPTTLDLMTLLAERSAKAPLMIVATARPEFRAPWPTRAHHTAMSLVPLDRAQIRRMVAAIAQRHALSHHVVEGLGDRSGGVPLFVEEVTRLMLEGGATSIPPTLQQSLAARLDRLGEAREVAQIGAVLGRSFSRALIAAVSALPDAALDGALEKLMQADLLFVEGAGPFSIYRFKHALIQDAAYESLLKTQRQTLHRAAAQELASSPESRPELVAHHFTQSGQTERAVEWWDKAGDAALRRSAFQEAGAHFGKAIELYERESRALPRPAASDAPKDVVAWLAGVRAKYAHALLITEGHAASTTRRAFEAMDAAHDADEPQQVVALFGQWTQHSLSGRLAQALEATQGALVGAETARLTMVAAAAHRLTSLTSFMMGSLSAARRHAERAEDLYDERWAEVHRAATGLDFLACSYTYHSLALSALGELEAAQARIEEALKRVDELHQPWSSAVVRAHELVRLGVLDRPADALPVAEALAEIAATHNIGAWAPHARLYRAWASGRLGNPAPAAKALQDALPQIRAANAHALELIVLHMLADLCVAAKSDEDASRYAEEGLATATAHGAGLSLSPLHRMLGDSLAARDPAAAESAYRDALRVAREQGSRTFELQACLRLAGLLHAHGRSAEAHDALAPALKGFSPTRELPAVAQAQALLDVLTAKVSPSPHASRD